MAARTNSSWARLGELERKVMKLVRRDSQVRRIMTVPGVGPINQPPDSKRQNTFA